MSGKNIWFTALSSTEGAYVGILEDLSSVLVNNSFTMKVGDILCLLTDGITEAMHHDGGSSMFDVSGVCELVKCKAQQPVDEIRDAVVTAVRDWSDQIPDGDISIVVIRRIR